MKSFVLKTDPLGERDLLVTALSRERGKERLRVPGVRRGEAKLKGHVQPYAWSFLHVAAGRIQRVVVDAECLDSAEIYSIETVRALAFLAALVDSITIEHEPVGVFFSYLERATETVHAASTSHPVSAALFWGARLFDEAGYALTVSSCGDCKEKIGSNGAWSGLQKNFVCSDCAKKRNDVRMLTPEALKVLRFLQSGGEEHAARLRLDELLQREVCTFLLDVARLLSGSPTV